MCLHVSIYEAALLVGNVNTICDLIRVSLYYSCW